MSRITQFHHGPLPKVKTLIKRASKHKTPGRLRARKASIIRRKILTDNIDKLDLLKKSLPS